MKLRRPSLATVVAFLALIVSLTGTTYAATGGNFILGHANTAGQVTKLTNPNGTALSLGSKAGTPALRVSNNQQVPKLNAQFVGGRSAGELQTWVSTERADGPNTPAVTSLPGSLNPWGGAGVLEVEVTKHLKKSCLVATYQASNYATGAIGPFFYGVSIHDAADTKQGEFVDKWLFNATSFHLGWSGTGTFTGLDPGTYTVRLKVASGTVGQSIVTDNNDHASLTVIESPTGC